MSAEITVSRLDWERLLMLETEYAGYRAAVEAIHKAEAHELLRETLAQVVEELRRK